MKKKKRQNQHHNSRVNLKIRGSASITKLGFLHCHRRLVFVFGSTSKEVEKHDGVRHGTDTLRNIVRRQREHKTTKGQPQRGNALWTGLQPIINYSRDQIRSIGWVGSLSQNGQGRLRSLSVPNTSCQRPTIMLAIYKYPSDPPQGWRGQKAQSQSPEPSAQRS